jgi:hypothetical protein
MDTPRGLCPNCDHYLSDYRRERQSTAQREIVLYWLICTKCRHVALHDWSFVDEAVPEPRAEFSAAACRAGS